MQGGAIGGKLLRFHCPAQLGSGSQGRSRAHTGHTALMKINSWATGTVSVNVLAVTALGVPPFHESALWCVNAKRVNAMQTGTP